MGQPITWLNFCRFHTKLKLPTKAEQAAKKAAPKEPDPLADVKWGLLPLGGRKHLNLFSRSDVLRLISLLDDDEVLALGILKVPLPNKRIRLSVTGESMAEMLAEEAYVPPAPSRVATDAIYV